MNGTQMRKSLQETELRLTYSHRISSLICFKQRVIHSMNFYEIISLIGDYQELNLKGEFT